MSWQNDSNGLPYICDQAGHVPTTPDIVRRCWTTGIQMAATKLEVEIAFDR